MHALELISAIVTRQNAKQTRALIQQGRASQGQSGLVEWIATDSSTAEVYVRGSAGDTEMDRTQFTRFLFLMISAFFAWEDSFYQHRDGLVEDARHTAMTTTIGVILSGPGATAAWQMGRSSFAVEFQSFVDGILQDAHKDAAPVRDSLEIWKALLSAEQAV